MPAAVTPITDHTVRALAALPTQFQEKDILRAIVAAFADEIQEMEDVAADLCLLRQIVDCTGEQLDGWGEIVGELRAGRSDADYRTGIYAKIYRDNSCGEPNRMITAAKTITGAEGVLYAPGAAAATYSLTITNATTEPANMQTIMEAISPNGVGVDITFTP
jgi:hypothetical protein